MTHKNGRELRAENYPNIMCGVEPLVIKVLKLLGSSSRGSKTPDLLGLVLLGSQRTFQVASIDNVCFIGSRTVLQTYFPSVT